MSGARSAWEARAENLGESLSGVLFKGFSSGANGVLHDWHTKIIEEILVPRVREGGAFADLGCGYGRLANVLADRRPDVFLIGQDLSHHYCAMLARDGRPSVQADLARLPFRPASLAGAMAVTSLMYADRDRLAEIMAGIRRMLEPGAPFLVLDPGEELRSVIARLGAARVQSSTGGKGFHRDEYLRIAKGAGFDVQMAGGNPRDSLAIVATAGGHMAWAAASKLFRRDDVSGGYARFCLHRWLLLSAPMEGED
jgi:SAM-dependent methyltransferase